MRKHVENKMELEEKETVRVGNAEWREIQRRMIHILSDNVN